MSQNNNGRPSRSRLRLVALGFAGLILVAVVSAALVLSGWRTYPAVEITEEPQPLSPQEVAEVKAAVEKQIGTPIRYVGGIRQDVVEAFPDGLRGRPAYRVKKTDKGWKVIQMFHAYFG
jgi:hypothetical protein